MRRSSVADAYKWVLFGTTDNSVQSTSYWLRFDSIRFDLPELGDTEGPEQAPDGGRAVAAGLGQDGAAGAEGGARQLRHQGEARLVVVLVVLAPAAAGARVVARARPEDASNLGL